MTKEVWIVIIYSVMKNELSIYQIWIILIKFKHAVSASIEYITCIFSKVQNTRSEVIVFDVVLVHGPLNFLAFLLHLDGHSLQQAVEFPVLVYFLDLPKSLPSRFVGMYWCAHLTPEGVEKNARSGTRDLCLMAERNTSHRFIRCKGPGEYAHVDASPLATHIMQHWATNIPNEAPKCHI